MPGLSVTLRPAGPDDREFLLRAYAGTRADELRAVPWPDAVKEAFVRQQFEAQDRHYRAHYTGASFDVIEVDGVPAGRFYVLRGPAGIRVMDIVLLPEHRGRGLGERLLRGVLDEAASAGVPVTIHVEKTNRARRLYERLGFRDAEDRGAYLLMEWRGDAAPISAKGTSRIG